MTAAVYIRVSTEEQAREGLSLAMQEEACRRAALAAGALRVEVFRDEGFSGMSLDRPALQALLSRLEEFDALYIYRLDRLGRRLRQRLALLDALMEAGVALHSVTEHIDLDTIMGRAMVQIMAVMAEVEVETLRQRIRDALAHRALTLRLGSSRPAYGYDYHADGQPWTINPEEAAVVRQLFSRYASGETIVELARWLNAAGVPLKHQGKQWWPRTVWQILANPVYVGQFRWNGQLVPGRHEPLIEESLWQQVQDRLRLHTQIRPPGRRSTSLSPFLRCGLCGAHICRSNSGGKTHEPGRYNCHASLSLPPGQRHESVSATARKVEEAIWRAVEWLTGEEVLTQALSRYGRGRSRHPRLSVWRARVAEIDREVDYNLRAARAGAVDVEVLARANRPLLEEKQALLDRIAAEQARPQQERALRELGRRRMPEVIAELRQAPGDAQIGFLRRIFARGELYPKQVRLVFLHPEIPPLICDLPHFYAPSRGCDRFPAPRFEEHASE